MIATFTTTATSGARSSVRFVDVASAVGPSFVKLPYALRIVFENVLRHTRQSEQVAGLASDWLAARTSKAEIEFRPGRILMHDTTCVPALVDIAALRSTLAENGGDPEQLSPRLPIDVSVDHSAAVVHFASSDALARNMRREIELNRERYVFMKWASDALPRFRVHPPGTGIMHTINLEQLATVVVADGTDGAGLAFPDTLIGTDSHTPMVNGLGVLAWGVGGIEAEGVMFGLPVSLRLPDVTGVRLTNRLAPGCFATDLALTVTERLRQIDLAESFVEFHGPGVSTLTVGERAVVANMTPEFGGATGYFPIDGETLRYLARTGRAADHVALVEAYAKAAGLWFDPAHDPLYSEIVDIDLATIEPSVSGPRRPQDRRPASGTRQALEDADRAPPESGKIDAVLPRWPIAIAAITSCTNTTDPELLIAAGLVARKAAAFGLEPPKWVKTSLAPGSPAAARFLERAGLLDDLAAVGFDIVGYGCTTCIGNSGELTPEIRAYLAEGGAGAVAVLSGNRNFPGRVHPDLTDGFLASPALVVAFALAGDADRDILTDPIARRADGCAVTLADLWPSRSEIDALSERAIRVEDFPDAFAAAEESPEWKALPAPAGACYPWDAASTYIRRPPFVRRIHGARAPVRDAAPLIVLGDDITTDHISPAGQIGAESLAGRHLIAQGRPPGDLNVFAAHRGNWEVMLRGLFTNKTVTNLLGHDLAPGCTVVSPAESVMPLSAAADHYATRGVQTVIVAGERYGMGSSRDWAAKGVALLGVSAVCATTFERIHRANLIGMGILPVRLPAAAHPGGLRLTAHDRISLVEAGRGLEPGMAIQVEIRRSDGTVERYSAQAAIQTALEVRIIESGGMLPMILSGATETP